MSRTFSKLPIDIIRILQRTFKVIGSDVVWKHACHSRQVHSAGDLAGKLNAKGYREVSFTVDGKRYYMPAQRVAWMLDRKRTIPNGYFIDHKDGNTVNNNPRNLRCVSQATNSRNRTKPICTASTGLMNVVHDEPSWYSRLSVCGKRTRLGPFRTAYEACSAFWELKVSKEPKMEKHWRELRNQQLTLAQSMDAKYKPVKKHRPHCGNNHRRRIANGK